MSTVSYITYVHRKITGRCSYVSYEGWPIATSLKKAKAKDAFGSGTTVARLTVTSQARQDGLCMRSKFNKAHLGHHRQADIQQDLALSVPAQLDDRRQALQIICEKGHIRCINSNCSPCRSQKALRTRAGQHDGKARGASLASYPCLS